MKAISIHPFYACQIFAGHKTAEIRSWKTNYRGDLLICSTNKKFKNTIPGHALCVVELVDIVPWAKTKAMIDAAWMLPSDWQPGQYAWILKNPRMIKPIPLKGKLSLWNYDGEIEYLPTPKNDEEDEKQYNEIFKPLFV